jgi:hypothetical protein
LFFAGKKNLLLSVVKDEKICNHFHLNHQVKLGNSELGLFFFGSFQFIVLLLPSVVDL